MKETFSSTSSNNLEAKTLISWEDAYRTTPPWDIGRPQPAFVGLVRAGELTGNTVLDVGCGTGENALYLAQNGFSVVGVDLSTRAIVAAKAKAEERKLKIDFRLANALSLEFQSGRFDNAIDSGLFHTFTDNDRISFAHEIARVLTRNPKGTYSYHAASRSHARSSQASGSDDTRGASDSWRISRFGGRWRTTSRVFGGWNDHIVTQGLSEHPRLPSTRLVCNNKQRGYRSCFTRHLLCTYRHFLVS